jgi:hypothetical protein
MNPLWLILGGFLGIVAYEIFKTWWRDRRSFVIKFYPEDGGVYRIVSDRPATWAEAKALQLAIQNVPDVIKLDPRLETRHWKFDGRPLPPRI